MKKISIIPIYNEEERILDVLTACENYIDVFVIINDGSSDGSMEKVRYWSSNKVNVHIIDNKINHGMSWAVKEGMRFVQNNKEKLSIDDNDIIIQIDGDDQHYVPSIDENIDYMVKNNVDYLITRRKLGGYPLIKIIGNKLMSLFISLLTFRRFYDVESGYRFMKVKVLPDLLLYTVGYRYSWAQEMAVICVRAGFNVDNKLEIETKYYGDRGTNIGDAFINCLCSSVFLHINILLKMKYR